MNVALGRPSKQSSTEKQSSFATDGDHPNSKNAKCSLTESQKNPWWQVDLGKEFLVRDVYIFIYYGCNVDYLLEIRIGNHDLPNLSKNLLCGGTFTFKNEYWRAIRCPRPLRGRFVTITRLVEKGQLMLCEVEVRPEGEWKKLFHIDAEALIKVIYHSW